uniref:PH domain-containing protein n=1 Tax=Cyprinus carpio TaxID=7962 RepID=A0A8C1UI31_CYPCA
MSNKKKPTTSTFFSEPAMVEELYTGYLLKSPAQPALTKNIKSWKRRCFVLSKTREDFYQLTYDANNETKEIDLSKISLLFIGPEAHQKWDWIQKNFKCSPSSVLFLKVEDDTLKHSRDYFLIGENRFSLEPKVEDQPDDRRSAPELMLTYPSPYSHYDYPRKLSEPQVPVTLKNPVIEHKDEKDEMQDESAEDSSEYMCMASFTSINGHKSSVCNGAVNQDEDNENKCALCIKCIFLFCSETNTHVEKEICVSQSDLKNSLILTQEEGKPCVSDCQMIQNLSLFHKGDQILAFNDLLIDTVEEIQMYLRRLSKDEVKLTIRRLIGSQPLHS